MPDSTDLETRVKKLEDIFTRLTAMAKQHPMGKIIVDALGLDES